MDLGPGLLDFGLSLSVLSHKWRAFRPEAVHWPGREGRASRAARISNPHEVIFGLARTPTLPNSIAKLGGIQEEDDDEDENEAADEAAREMMWPTETSWHIFLGQKSFG